MKYSDGSSYEGDWKDGHAIGHGTYKTIAGDLYEGEFALD